MQANYGENEIQSLLQKVRIFNKEIGSYQLFAITDSFDYAVKLSNGRILIKIEELQDDERDALTPDRLTAISKRFISSTAETNSKQTQTTQRISIKPKPTKDTLPKKSNTKTFAIVLIVIVAAIILTSILNNSGSSYQEKIMTVEEIELSQPTSFLSADGDYRENFWGNKFKVNCTITNKATVATYKDATVRVTYYSKTKTVLGSNDYTVYEVFSPTSTKTVELTIENYKDVESIGWEVISAISN
jgi:type II secretory pathway pseudopilin PulG